MNLTRVADNLRDGPVTFIARGQSMTPIVTDGQVVTVEPVDGYSVQRGDVVLARLGRYWYLHLVTAVEKYRVQISNNHGRVNGWTGRSKVVGRLVR